MPSLSLLNLLTFAPQLRSSFGMYELRYGNLQKTFYRDNFRSLLYAAISHVTHHALRRYLNRHNEMHFLCLTKKTQPEDDLYCRHKED